MMRQHPLYMIKSETYMRHGSPRTVGPKRSVNSLHALWKYCYFRDSCSVAN